MNSNSYPKNLLSSIFLSTSSHDVQPAPSSEDLQRLARRHRRYHPEVTAQSRGKGRRRVITGWMECPIAAVQEMSMQTAWAPVTNQEWGLPLPVGCRDKTGLR